MLSRKLKVTKYDVAKLSDLSSRIYTGITPQAKGAAYIKPPEGVRFIRSGEITSDGAVLPKSLIHITEETHANLMQRSQVRHKDLLIAIVGATIGAVGIYDSQEPANINQAIAGVSLDENIILTEYASLYLRSSIGQAMLSFTKRPVARANINLQEIGNTQLLVPSVPVQDRLVAKMESSNNNRKQKLEQAEKLFLNLNNVICKAIDIQIDSHINRTAFATQTLMLSNARMDPYYYSPAFQHLVAEIKKKPHRKLGDIVGFSSTQVDPAKMNGNVDTFGYIEISCVNRRSGDIKANHTLISKAPSRARMLVKKGNIIVSLTRPHHGSIALIDDKHDSYIASTGFAVINEYKNKDVLPQYLVAILRSPLCLKQMLQRSSGGNYPAITRNELKNILVPIPDIQIQRMIISEVKKRHDDARKLREEAKTEWEAAMASFEAQLLGQEIDR